MLFTNYSFKNPISLSIYLSIYIYIYIYTQDLALNKLQGLICHKTQPTNQPIFYDIYIFMDIVSPMQFLYQPTSSLITPYHLTS